MPKLLALIAVMTLAPMALLAADYEFKITYDELSRDMRHGMMKKFVGSYEFTARSDYRAAQTAHDEFVDRLNTLDRDLRRDTEGTQQQRYERFLARLAECREASKVLESALSRGRKN